MLRRLDFLEEFRNYFTSSFIRISGLKYTPVIEYYSDIFNNDELKAFEVNELKTRLQLALNDKLDMEIKKGISLIGPHRDGYMFFMDKSGELFEMRTFASQGEHKTFVISLKLSEFGYINENLKHTNTGEPILLLDDIFSELDKGRINRIAGLITDFNQVFVTTTDKDHLNILKNNFNDSRSFHIVNGSSELIC